MTELSSGIYQTVFEVHLDYPNLWDLRIAQAKNIAAKPYIKGAMVVITLGELIDANYRIKKKTIARVKNLIGHLRYDQQVILTIKERWFGAKKPSHVYFPKKWMDDGRGWYKENDRTLPAYWNAQHAISLGIAYAKIANQTGVHCVNWGETSSPRPGGQDIHYKEGLKTCIDAFRYWAPNITLGIEPNFLLNEAHLTDFVKHAKELENVITLFPDTLQCRKSGEFNCGPGCGNEKIPGYDIAKQLGIRLGGQFQTRHMHWNNYPNDVGWAIDFGMDVLVQWNNHFYSEDKRSAQKNSDPAWPSYCDDVAKQFYQALERPKNEEPLMPTEVRPKNLKVPDYLKWRKNAFGFNESRVANPNLPAGFDPKKYKYYHAHKYATQYPWTPGGKGFLTYESGAGRSLFLDGSNGKFLDVIEHGLREVMLIDTPTGRALVGLRGDDLMLYKLSDNRAHKLAGGFKGYSVGQTEGHITQTGWLLLTKVDGNDVYCKRVRIVNGILTDSSENLVLSGEGVGFDTATVSESGNYILSKSKGRGTSVYAVKDNSELTIRHQINKKTHHGLVTVDTDGRDIYVELGHILGDGARVARACDLKTREWRTLYGGKGKYTNNHKSNNMSLAGHIGHGPRGWVFMSLCIDDAGPHTCGFLKTDGSGKYIPVAHTYDTKGQYLFQAHGVARRDGKRAVIAAEYNGDRVAVFIDTSPIVDQLIENAPAPIESEPEPASVLEPDILRDEINTIIERIENLKKSLDRELDAITGGLND